jgi:hypothetical protein
MLLRIGAVLTVVVSGLASMKAQEFRITRLEVVRKPGKADGKAMATVLQPVKVKDQVVEKEKTGSIEAHVMQAWPVMNGHAALLLMSPAKPGQPYRLRYYQLDAAKGRFLGSVPFSHAEMTEFTGLNTWAFAVSGTDPATKQPMIFAGDANAIHARLSHASAPHFTEDSLSFHSSGGTGTIAMATLMGWKTTDRIYQMPAGQAGEYLQFFPDGTSFETTANGQVERGSWIVDGENIHVTRKNAPDRAWRLDQLQTVTGIPADSRLTVRLLGPLSSRTAKKGMEVKAVLTSPAVFENKILIPQGSEFDGSVVDAHGVGLGIKHETAAVTVHFSSVKLPDNRVLPIDAHVLAVANSREEVTKSGRIQGIRSTGTLGHTAENQINSLAQIDPVGYIFTSTAGPAVLGFAEPEILYNAGTELDIAFNKPVITSQKYDAHVPYLALSQEETSRLDNIVKHLPYRTETLVGHVPSDITNLIFIGTPEALRRGLEAAGWTPADSLTAAATFQTVKTLTGNEVYTQAPMSVLTLAGKNPVFTLQKTTNTFSSRHHLRVFPTGETFDEQPVLTASSTQDIGIAFSYRQKTFIHVIDQYLDNERSKVVNDLGLTGCVTGLAMVARRWVPQDAYNSTGDRLRTDGDAALLKLNDCSHPYATPTTPAKRAPLLERSERNTMLTIKDTLFRGNLIYTGVSGGIKVHHYLAIQGELGKEPGNWRKNDASGTNYRIANVAGEQRPNRIDLAQQLSPENQRELEVASKALIVAHKWDPPRFEIALNLGYSNYRNNILETTAVLLASSDPTKPLYAIGLADGVFDGWAAGISLTLNTWNWISNEFSYTRQQTKFDLIEITIPSNSDEEASIDARTVGLVTRRFAYNTIFNLRPRKSRWRPYISAGPAFQLLALSDAPLKKPAGYFKLGLSNIGLLKAAFDFGSTPPLNGGGIFQFGLQYGGGIKYRVTPRFMLRGDYGETWSANPKIIRDSYLGYLPDNLDNTYTTDVTNTRPPTKYIQQRATVGFAFTF